MTLLPIEKALDLRMKIQIEEQITLRKSLIHEMVGRVYPARLEDEIRELEEILKECRPSYSWEEREKAMKQKMQHCINCRNDFYNNKNDKGIEHCWSLENMQLTLRKRVHIDQRPPWTQSPDNLPNCYHQDGYVFVDPDRIQ